MDAHAAGSDRRRIESQGVWQVLAPVRAQGGRRKIFLSTHQIEGPNLVSIATKPPVPAEKVTVD